MANLRERLKEKLLPLVKEENLELVELEFSPSGSKSLLRMYVDKPASRCPNYWARPSRIRRRVTIDECAKLSRKVSDFLDMEDLIPHRYNLEVSSPGLDRPLIKKEDFVRRVGEKVRVFLNEPVDGKMELVGEIKNFCEGTLYLSTPSEETESVGGKEGEEKAVPISNVLKAKIIY
jgi:ribosome maturation factor RimP